MEHAHDAHAHPTPKLYALILGALIIFTGITVWVAFQDFGVLNNVIALGIAGVKTVLVVLFFMHVKYGSRLTKIFAVTGFAFLAILISFTVSDTEVRKHWGQQKSVYGPQGWAPLPYEVKEPGAPAAGHGEQHGQAAESHH
jgi:cytochrome c oxidase subunit 4